MYTCTLASSYQFSYYMSCYIIPKQTEVVRRMFEIIIWVCHKHDLTHVFISFMLKLAETLVHKCTNLGLSNTFYHSTNNMNKYKNPLLYVFGEWVKTYVSNGIIYTETYSRLTVLQSATQPVSRYSNCQY